MNTTNQIQYSAWHVDEEGRDFRYRWNAEGNNWDRDYSQDGSRYAPMESL
jgi:hypothetical protein